MTFYLHTVCTYTSTCTRCSRHKHVTTPYLWLWSLSVTNPTRTESEISLAARTIRQHLRKPRVLYNVHKSPPAITCPTPYPRGYFFTITLNPLNPELNPICYLLALLGAHHFLHVSRIRVKLLTFRLLMSYIYIYIYGAPILDVSRSHTTQHSR